jgi:hypothetical protein
MTAPQQCGLDALSFFSSHWLRRDNLRTLNIALNDPELALAEGTLKRENLLLDDAPVPTAKPLKYGYYKHLLKMFDDISVPYFALSPRLLGNDTPPPSPPGPQYYWRLRDSKWSTEGEDDKMWERMRQEGEKQKEKDEQTCVDMLLAYVGEPRHPPPQLLSLHILFFLPTFNQPLFWAARHVSGHIA